MSIDFLPETYTRAVRLTIAVPVSGVPDLTDPVTGRILRPERVEISLRQDEGTPRGDRAHAYVNVVGPRRLKSRAYGKAIVSTGWQAAENQSFRGYVPRPQWLTERLAAHLPEGWCGRLLDLDGES